MTQPGLNDYAIIGDCSTAAIISKEGSIDWLCLPVFHSPSIFGRLLDTKAGHFQITCNEIISIHRRYLPNTAILETIFTCKNGSLRLTDTMTILSNARNSHDLRPLHEILRKVEVLDGEVFLKICLSPQPKYGKPTTKCKIKFRKKLGWGIFFGNALLNLISDIPIKKQQGTLIAERNVKNDDVFWFSLTYQFNQPGVLLPLGSEANSRILQTANWWQNWCKQCNYKGPWEKEMVQSAIMLRLLTYPPSGSLLAAATTSLPEHKQGWMNWDYRFCWPRDASFTLRAFIGLGFYSEVPSFFNWLMLAAAITKPYISIMYNIYGNYKIKERILPWLEGYQGAKPVRIGNALLHQFQLDVYGEVISAIETWVKHVGKLEEDERTLVEGFGRVIVESWQQPDNGIWELRDKRRHYTYSKVMAWYVLETFIRLHEQEHIQIPLEHYKKERDTIRKLVEEKGFNQQRQCFVAEFDGSDVDASLLLLPSCGFVQYNDPRMVKTWEAIQHDLEKNGLLRRFPPGYGGTEGDDFVFTICNFWAIQYLIGCGKLEEAETRLQYLISLQNDVGIYAEGLDAESLTLMGNFPQTYSHTGLINSLLFLQSKKS